jgi:excinuclease ABC subunit C
MEKRRTPPRVRRSSHVREHRHHDGGRDRAHPAESNQEETITTMSLSRPENIPTAPGVYQYLDRDGRVLYVGKAKNLRHRISSYFNGEPHPRTARMLGLAEDLTWVICASEAEALVLEREWISRKQPPFNVRLRAGHGYGGVAVTSERIPRLHTWRGERPKGGRSFGPYPGVRSGELLDALTVLFQVRSCRPEEFQRAERNGRACLLGETGRCLAPCVKVDAVTEHASAAERLVAHLKNPDRRLAEETETLMHAEAARENFESAGALRDRLRALEVIGRRQRVTQEPGWNRRAAVLRRDGDRMVLAVARAEDGSVAAVDIYHAETDWERDDFGNLEAAVGQIPVPAVVIEGRDGLLITENTVTGGRRARGERERALLSFAANQAEEALRTVRTTPVRDVAGRLEAVEAVRERLGIDSARRIECIDISHTAGREAVGSLVVLEDGVAVRGQFRALDLGTTDGDDYRAIEETVRRRFTGRRLGLPTLPEVLLIDGGPGQVAAAARGLEAAAVQPANHGGDGPYLLGIAKRFEELWPLGNERPLLLGQDDRELLLLVAARDLAHSNGVAHHRRRRDRRAGRTLLDDVDGLGPARRRALLAHFGTLDALGAAPAQEIATVRGIGDGLAGRIWAALHPGTPDPGTPE